MLLRAQVTMQSCGSLNSSIKGSAYVSKFQEEIILPFPTITCFGTYRGGWHTWKHHSLVDSDPAPVHQSPQAQQ